MVAVVTVDDLVVAFAYLTQGFLWKTCDLPLLDVDDECDLNRDLIVWLQTYLLCGDDVSAMEVDVDAVESEMLLGAKSCHCSPARLTVISQLMAFDDMMTSVMSVLQACK